MLIFITQFFLAFTLIGCFAQKTLEGLTPIDKVEFEKGKIVAGILLDGNAEKSEGKTKIGRCPEFVDDTTVDNFHEYNYLGTLPRNKILKIVGRQDYHGEKYIVVDSVSCTATELLGMPYVFDSTIINFNESATTDRLNLIEVWTIANNKIRKKKEIKLNSHLAIVDARLSGRNTLLMKDHNGKYWKISL